MHTRTDTHTQPDERAGPSLLPISSSGLFDECPCLSETCLFLGTREAGSLEGKGDMKCKCVCSCVCVECECACACVFIVRLKNGVERIENIQVPRFTNSTT